VDALLKNEAVRARMAAIWKMRVESEHVATARFAAYAERMKSLGGIPQQFQDEAIQSSEQELTHREVCFNMAHRLRCEEIVLTAPDFTPPSTIGPENVLADMVDFCCFQESCNVAHLSVSYRAITDRDLRLATRKILADEVKHSRLGWAYLAWARGQGLGEELGRHIPQMLWTAAAPALFSNPTPHPEQALLTEMGDPSMRARHAVFVDTLENVLFPGLEQHGIDTGPARAWLAVPSWPNRGSALAG
jgi:hypothetical protein